MLAFPWYAEDPPRLNKPHIKADMQSVIFIGPFGPRIGYADDGYVFDVAKDIYEYMKGE